MERVPIPASEEVSPTLWWRLLNVNPAIPHDLLPGCWRPRSDTVMAKSRHDQLPTSRSIAELVELFDTTDMGELMDQMPEVEAEVKLTRRRHLVELEEDLVARLDATACAQKVSSQALVNTFLREKLAEAR